MLGVPDTGVTDDDNGKANRMITDRIIADLNDRFDITTRKHGPLDSDMAALGVLTEEYHEVIDAIRRGEAWKVRAELLDLANGCIRRIHTLDAGHTVAGATA